MMIKVSDYIAKFLIEHGITTVFTVVGGGAMHLNDSFGHNESLHCVYQHHEQACSMAAEGYAKVNNRMAALCVTSGPGGINALNGVAGAYQDSTPMLVFSGQVKRSLTIKNSGLDLRTLGGQEFDIISAVSNMTKYAEMLDDPADIRYCLEKAFYYATNGRPGPCWLDIPVDVQGARIEEESLRGFDISENDDKYPEAEIKPEKLIETVEMVIDKLNTSNRPVFYAGNGIRIAGAMDEFNDVVKKLNLPVVTCWDSIDLISTDDEHYVGRGGTMGDRAGNFAVQNSDMILAVGNRLSILQVGYDVNTWARQAYVVDVDIDPNELKKPTIRVDLPICSDAKVFLKALSERIDAADPDKRKDWSERCQSWKSAYPVVMKRHFEQTGRTNVYSFMDELSRGCGKEHITVASNGSASVVGSQSYYIGKGQRFIMNCALSSMGYGLPASIGACIANDYRTTVCIEGDGSIQMNIQELQTVVTNRLPIKIFVINNEGYHQIRQTQNNIFHNGLVGVGPESRDLGFPDFEKISWAYGIPYVRIENNEQLREKIVAVFESETFCLCEVMCDKGQIFEPKSATKRLSDGTLVSPPLEDLAPFLPREELKKNMIIDLVGE